MKKGFKYKYKYKSDSATNIAEHPKGRFMIGKSLATTIGVYNKVANPNVKDPDIATLTPFE